MVGNTCHMFLLYSKILKGTLFFFQQVNWLLLCYFEYHIRLRVYCKYLINPFELLL